MTRAERGWLAGIVDGEGCLTAHLQPRPGSQHKKLCYDVVVTNTDPRIIHKVRSLVEDIIGFAKIRVLEYRSDQKYTGAWDRYEVHVTRAEHIIAFLTKIQPDLIGKKDQAIAMIEHLKWRGAQDRSLNLPYTEEVYRRDAQFATLMNRLNNHGKPRTRRGHTEGTDVKVSEEMVPSPEQSGSAL